VNKNDRIKPQIDVAVRKLAESIRRDGGLASVMQGGISGVEGTRIHQHFLKTAGYRFPGCELYPEESLSCRFTANDLPYDLNVQGRQTATNACNYTLPHSSRPQYGKQAPRSASAL
jgi:hypothetical protein